MCACASTTGAARAWLRLATQMHSSARAHIHTHTHHTPEQHTRYIYTTHTHTHNTLHKAQERSEQPIDALLDWAGGSSSGSAARGTFTVRLVVLARGYLVAEAEAVIVVTSTAASGGVVSVARMPEARHHGESSKRGATSLRRVTPSRPTSMAGSRQRSRCRSFCSTTACAAQTAAACASRELRCTACLLHSELLPGRSTTHMPPDPRCPQARDIGGIFRSSSTCMARWPLL